MYAKTFLSAAAFAAFAIMTPAGAQPFDFRYQSFELETDGGRDALMARLDQSIERYCGADRVRGLSARKASLKCRDEIKEQVLAQFGQADFAQLDGR